MKIPDEERNTFTKADLMKMWKRPPQVQFGVSIAKILEAFVKTGGNIAVSWSGGKDSTTLLYLVACLWVRQYGERPLVVAFSDTTNEFAAIYTFLPQFLQWLQQKTGVNVQFKKIRPPAGTTFITVAREEGLPLISKTVSMCVRKLRKYLKKLNLTWADVKPYCQYKNRECVKTLKSMGLNDAAVLICTGYATKYDTFSRTYMLPKRWHPLMESDIPISEQCCYRLKKSTMNEALAEMGIYTVFLGEMACDSRQREKAYLKTGCTNIINGVGKSKPFGPLLEQTLLGYIKVTEIPQSSYYGDLCEVDGRLCYSKHDRGGCALCGFGIEKEPDRFMKLYHEDYAKCRIAFLPKDKGGLGYKEACEFLNARCGMNIQIPQINDTEVDTGAQNNGD